MQDHITHPGMETSVLRILTQNIHKGMSAGNTRFVLHQLRDEIRETRADVVLLQEVQGEHGPRSDRISGWPAESQFEFLADQSWHHHAYARNAVYEHGDHGNALLSGYPIIGWDNLNVSTMAHASRSILHARIDIPGPQPLHVMCVHFGLGPLERARQTAELIRRVRAAVPDTAPLVIGGDFNDWRGRMGQQLERGLNVREAFRMQDGRHARTFPAWLPILPVDRIYYRGLRLVSCQRGSTHRWRSLSDHLPLICDLQLPGETC